MSDMHGSRCASLLNTHLLAVDGHGGWGHALLRRQRRRSSSSAFLPQGGKSRLGGTQRELSEQAGLHPVGQVQPVFAGSWRQATEGTKNLLPGTFGSAEGFDEEVIVVGFAFVSLGSLADVHGTLHTSYQ